MNTGFLGPAVATVLTACGIETYRMYSQRIALYTSLLQQYLPLAVLKRDLQLITTDLIPQMVATVLTACGIET